MVFIFIFIYFYTKDYRTLKLIAYLPKTTPSFKISEGIKRLSVASLLVISKALININKYSRVAPQKPSSLSLLLFSSS